METTPYGTLSDIPPIVLFVEDDRDTLDMYSAYFEMSGLWVARSSTPADALSGISDLRPNLVVTEFGFLEPGQGADFVHTLKSRSDTRDIPVIVLSGQPTGSIPIQTMAEADLCLTKPVLPDELLSRARRLLARASQLIERAKTISERAAELRAQTELLRARRREISATLATYVRACPGCGHPLEWIERGRIGGVEYDYYRWCLKGCGLYCYDRGSSRWVKLV